MNIQKIISSSYVLSATHKGSEHISLRPKEVAKAVSLLYLGLVYISFKNTSFNVIVYTNLQNVP